MTELLRIRKDKEDHHDPVRVSHLLVDTHPIHGF